MTDLKLEWAGRLTVVLLNDATDALRWFLLENLPRKRNCKADLDELLRENKQMFVDLRDGGEFPKAINHEMFDILYREDGRNIDSADLEIQLIFVLIRFLCKLRHPSWKWWDVEPLIHQNSPLYDVIRVVRFKNAMKSSVHEYEITEESFQSAWTYITSVLDNLNCYKRSARRWENDVIDSDVTNIFTKLTETMRWQTLELTERDLVYLNLKQSRKIKLEKDHLADDFSEFIGNFGQRQKHNLTRLNNPKPSSGYNGQHGMVTNTFTNGETSQAHILNVHLVNDVDYKPDGTSTGIHLKSHESIKTNGEDATKDHSMFIEAETGLVETSNKLRQLIFDFREFYIKFNCNITPLTSEPSTRIKMDDVVMNIGRVNQSLEGTTLVYDVPLYRPNIEALESWRNLLKIESPFRILLNGDWSSGKSVLLKKISYDWATCNEPRLKRFQLVFYVDLSLVGLDEPYTSLCDCVLEQCESLSDMTCSELEQHMQESNGASVLLLLDGAERLHDITSDVMSEICEVITGERWPNVSIIMTSAICVDYDEKDSLNRNVSHVIKSSRYPWQQFTTLGSTTGDVIMHSRRYFKSHVIEESDKRARSFLNYVRIFQRDVYTEVMTSPAFIYILASDWLTRCKELRCSELPERVSDVINKLFMRFDWSVFPDDFSLQVLHRTLAGDSCNNFCSGLFEENHLATLLRGPIFIEVQHCKMGKAIKFANVLFENYFAAKYLAEIYSTNEDKWCGILTSEINSLAVGIRLRHFLLFSCYLSKEVGELVINHLSSLIQTSLKSGINTVVEHSRQEATKNLCAQCFYEMRNTAETSNFLSKVSLKQSRSTSHWKHIRSDGRVLKLSDVRHISKRTEQSLLFLASECKPDLTRSGITMCYLDPHRNEYWIRCLDLHGLKGDQMRLVSNLLQSLPCLEVARFTEVRNATDDDVNQLCQGLNYHHNFPPALHTLCFTLYQSSMYDQCHVTSYRNIASTIKSLIYLDTLELTFTSAKLFLTLFDEHCSSIIPIREINISKFGLTKQQCQMLADSLERCIFVENLNISHNEIGSMLTEMCGKFHKLHNLQILNLASCCLTQLSIERLAQALCQPGTSKNIRYFDISQNHVQDKSSMFKLTLALKSLASLEYLDLSGNYLGDTAVCSLVSGISSTIQTLKLNFVQIGLVALSAIRYHLGSSTIVHLSIEGNYFGVESSDFFNKFSEVPGCDGHAPTFSKLQVLNLSGVSGKLVSKMSSASAKSLETFLETHQALEFVHLHHVVLTKHQIVSIANKCLDHKCLKQLRLSKSLCPLSDDEAAKWNVLVLE